MIRTTLVGIMFQAASPGLVSALPTNSSSMPYHNLASWLWSNHYAHSGCLKFELLSFNPLYSNPEEVRHSGLILIEDPMLNLLLKLPLKTVPRHIEVYLLSIDMRSRCGLHACVQFANLHTASRGCKEIINICSYFLYGVI